MFIEFTDKDNLFYKKYLRSFAARSSVSSVNLEEQEDSFETSLAINSHLEAYDYIFSGFLNKDVSLYDLPNIISLLTNGEISSFRNINIMVSGSTCSRTKPFLIRQELYSLFKEYDELKSLIDNPFLREAIFHIKFLKIHPFEDGNGRCARLLSCFNLCKSDIAPIVIPRNRKEEYCSYIENDNYDSLAKMFQELSKLEFRIMLDIYQKSDQIIKSTGR